MAKRRDGGRSEEFEFEFLDAAFAEGLDDEDQGEEGERPRLRMAREFRAEMKSVVSVELTV